MTHKFKGHSHAFTTTQCHAFLPFGFYTANCFEMISGTSLEKKNVFQDVATSPMHSKVRCPV